MLDRPGLEFSFSGLKTAVALAVRESELTPARRADIARGVEDAIVDTLVAKTLRAVEQTGLGDVVVAGGVGANATLRARLTAALGAVHARAYFPPLAFCTDNAAMIAVAGLARLVRGERAAGRAITARAQWPLASLAPPAASTT